MYQGSDLTGANLAGEELKGEDYSGADLTNANLQDADLENANLSGAKVDRANLKNATLNQADLSAASFIDTDFSYSNLENADITGSNLSNACLKYACLDNAQLAEVDLTDAILKYAGLAGTDLTEASLTGVNLAYAELPNATLVNTTLDRAELNYTELHSINLTDAEVVAAVFDHTEVPHANLTGVDLNSVSKFVAVQGLDTAFVDSGTLDYPDPSSNDSQGPDFTRENIISHQDGSLTDSPDFKQATADDQTRPARTGDNNVRQDEVVESGASASTTIADRIPSDIESVRSPPRTTVAYEDVELLEQINRGGQAVIHKARIKGYSSSPIAIREPASPTRSVPRDRAEVFLGQIERWENVDDHERDVPRWTDFEHVLGVIASGEKRPWVAIEYAEGGDAEDLLERHPIPVGQSLWIGECICKALQIAHEYGFKHLDIKPANVLFKKTDQGVWDWPKLGDWGLARRLATNSGEQEYKNDPYTAPEQFQSNNEAPDQLTDIYQTGATIYALLTGQPPYGGGMVSNQEAIVAATQPPSPSSQRDDIPTKVDDVIQKSLERHKDDRYRAITDLEDRLHNIRSTL